MVRQVLTEVGIKPERFDLQWASSAEAPRFVKLITDFTARMRELGPIGEAEGLNQEEVQKRLAVAVKLVEDRKVRMALGTATKAIRKDAIFTKEHIDAVMADKLAKSIQSGLAGSKG